MTEQTQQVEQMEEPAPGLYYGKDGGPGYWEHVEGVTSWRWLSCTGDPSPGPWMTWRQARVWGPFTPVSQPAPNPAVDPFMPDYRITALDFAARLNPADASQLVEYAHEIEGYLNGK